MTNLKKRVSYRFWITKKVLDNPLKSIFFPFIITLIIGSGLKFIVIDDNMMAMLPENMNSKLSWDSVQSEFGSTESIFVAFGKKNENIFNQKAFSHLWELTNALQKIDEVEKVTSISSIPKIESTDGFLEIIPLQPKSELSESQIDDIVKYLNDNSSIKKRSVSRNDNYFNVLVKPTDNIPHNILRDAVVQVGDSLLSKNYEIHYGGTAYITGSVPGMIKKDISMLLFIGLALMIMVL